MNGSVMMHLVIVRFALQKHTLVTVAVKLPRVHQH